MNQEQKQRTYDVVREHLLTQMKRSFDEKSCKCLYRGPNGVKCAIGALIPDAKYRSSMDNILRPLSAQHQTIIAALDESIVGELDGVIPMFLDDLQFIHDHCNPVDWQWRLDDFAMKYGLSVSKPLPTSITNAATNPGVEGPVMGDEAGEVVERERVMEGSGG